MNHGASFLLFLPIETHSYEFGDLFCCSLRGIFRLLLTSFLFLLPAIAAVGRQFPDQGRKLIHGPGGDEATDGTRSGSLPNRAITVSERPANSFHGTGVVHRAPLYASEYERMMRGLIPPRP